MAKLQKLSVSLSKFKELRRGGYLYVDKTRFAWELLDRGGYFFLARPRRFGKTLFVSMLEELLRGNKELFKGLWIAKRKYAWTKHGVIKLSLSGLECETVKGFRAELGLELREIGASYGISIPAYSSLKRTLTQLVKAMHQKFGAVAVLIDEYDFPILEHLKDRLLASRFRSALRSFFITLKELDSFVGFCFITGVASFSKAGVFSGLNNVPILSLTDSMAAVCGYTDEEIDHYFKAHIQEWAKVSRTSYSKKRAEIREWYDGYRFSKESPPIYNPFSLSQALQARELENFWFKSGAPSFLIQELKKRKRREELQLFDLEALQGSQELLESFELERIPLSALLFQTGYLTIASYEPLTGRYDLRYPNHEVRTTMSKYLLPLLAGMSDEAALQVTLNLRQLLEEGNLEGALRCLQTFFAQIPAKLHISEEKFYHALLQMAATASGIKAQSEIPTSRGVIDLVFELPSKIYIVEVKLGSQARTALTQITKRGYYESFLGGKKALWLVGLAIQRTTKRQGGKSGFKLSLASKRLVP